MIQNPSNTQVYNFTQKLASQHYENFPVASFLFPKEIRKDVALIYAFARTADDIVDESKDSADEKIKTLNSYRDEFLKSLSGNYRNTFWKLLHNTISNKMLEPNHFINLLSAFEQDIHQNEYRTYEELLNYCENSATPVGRIILELYGIRDEKIIHLSDKICTALQLTNFWQDVKIDLSKNRVYIPFEDFENHKIDKSVLNLEQTCDELRQIIKFEVNRTEKLFKEGSEILLFLPHRLKWQIKWTINGGLKILNKIRKNNYDILNFRPTLNKIDYIIALFQPVKLNAE